MTALELLKRKYIGQTITMFVTNEGYRMPLDELNLETANAALLNGRGKLHVSEVIDVIYTTEVYCKGEFVTNNHPHFQFVLKNERNLGFSVH